MTTDEAPNADQREYWNGDPAQHWVDEQTRYDEMLSGHGARLLRAAALTEADRVLDIGCGCGATTLAAARAASAGEAVGIDLSAAMVERARQRALDEGIGNARFETADAQTFRLPVPFNAAISRFGVMFFDDPVAAFANIASVLWPGGRLTFLTWQELSRNEWMTVPGGALAAHVDVSGMVPGGAGPGAGPFGLADPDRVRQILESAGFVDVSLETVKDSMLLGGIGTLDDAVEFLSHTGLGQVLKEAEADARARAVAAMREALSPYVTPEGVRIGTAAWLVTATRP